jgi:predicted fused transcriptional regulator/phosphomethylpyrimidine kinase
LKGLDQVADVVYDLGERGKEPMLRVLGRNPGEVVDKVLRIGKACESAS